MSISSEGSNPSLPARRSPASRSRRATAPHHRGIRPPPFPTTSTTVHLRPCRIARRTARCWGLLPTLGILSALLLVACGDSGGTATQAFGARVSPGVSLAAHLTIGGTYTVSATWTDDISDAASAASCADAAKGFFQDGLRYILPRAPLTTSFDGHVLGVVAGISGYHGPGGYDAPAVSGADGSQTVLAVDGAGWAAAGGGTVHVDVKADDSGMLVFQKLAPTPATPAPTVSGQPAPTPAVARTGSLTGTLTWTCTTVRPPVPSVTSSAAATPPQAPPAAPTPTTSGKPVGPTPTLPH